MATGEKYNAIPAKEPPQEQTERSSNTFDREVPRPEQHRNVIWDVQKEEKEDDENVQIPAHLLPPKPKAKKASRWSKLKVTDILEVSPVEEHAETYLQKQLEEKIAAKDEEESEMDELRSVLEGIPEEHLDALATSSKSVHSKNLHRKNDSKGGDKLFDMVNLLMDGVDHEEMQRTNMVKTDDDDYVQASEDQDITPTAHDALVKNAANLFLRKARERKQSKIDEFNRPTKPADKKTDEQATKMEEGMADQSGRALSDSEHGSDKKGGNKFRKTAGRLKSHVQGDFHDFVDFVKDSRGRVWSRIRGAAIFVVLPCMAGAFLCFYALGNPPCGTAEECDEAASGVPRRFPNGTEIEIEFLEDPSKQPSVSFWLLFLGVRLVCTLGLALLCQAFIIDFCCLMTQLTLRVLGSFITLFVVQSKGWPFIIFAWGLLNFGMLSGNGRFARHWLYWQDYLDIFNETNQAGEVLSHRFYINLLTCMVVAGATVAVKRYALGLYLGKRTYNRYASDLGNIMDKAVLIREVALLSRSKAKKDTRNNDENVQVILNTEAIDEQNQQSKDKDGAFTGAYLSGSTQMRINDLLGAFEEPDTLQEGEQNVAIADIIRFRQSVAFLNTPTPFSGAFGKADGREVCISSSQKVYERLVGLEGSDMLHFNTLAKLCMEDGDSELDEVKLRKLIKLFRPDRDGSLTKLDFVKSVDTVYKDIRLLRAGVANSQKVDRSSESIFHVVFYFILGCLCLAILGIDPIALFFAVSGIIVGFAFMIGPAFSKVFEGFLFILIRKPYEIGDKINVSSVTTDTPGGGSAGWLVKDMDLFNTTVTYWNGENATYSNGALAAHRIINMNRSDPAFQFFLQKFPSRVDYGKILMFRKCVEQFVKDRPREWMTFNGFRVTRVEIEQGFIEYKVMMTHREKWQNLGAVLDSTAAVQTFASELCKKMDIEYVAVPMPVDLNIVNNSAGGGRATKGHPQGKQSISSIDADKLMARVQSDADLANLDDFKDIKGLEIIQKLFAK